MFFSSYCLSPWYSLQTLHLVFSASYQHPSFTTKYLKSSDTKHRGLSRFNVGANLSLSAVKMTLRSRSREANTRRRRRRLKEEKRHSKSTCSRRESDGRHSSITWWWPKEKRWDEDKEKASNMSLWFIYEFQAVAGRSSHLRPRAR